MKKAFKMYVGYWFLLLVCFNALSFLIKLPSGYLVSKDKMFWPIYIIVTVIALAQLATTYYVMSKKPYGMFLRISIISFSYWTMVLSTIAGSVALLVANEYVRYVGAALCVIISIIYLFSAMQAEAASQYAEEVEKNLRTGFIISLRADASTLISSTQNPAIKAQLKKVCEGLRYSDPVNNESLFDVESNLSAKFGELKRAVAQDDLENSTKLAKEFLSFLEDRNNKCKASK